VSAGIAVFVGFLITVIVSFVFVSVVLSVVLAWFLPGAVLVVSFMGSPGSPGFGL
jgi:hypothetical protein